MMSSAWRRLPITTLTHTHTRAHVRKGQVRVHTCIVPNTHVCVCVWRYINIYIKRFQTKTNGQCVRVYVCQSFGVLMNFSALVRFLFVSFECRFVSSFYRYQRARNDAIPWAEDSSSSRREGKWRKERLVNFAINREQNLISACVGSLCGCVCVCVPA